MIRFRKISRGLIIKKIKGNVNCIRIRNLGLLLRITNLVKYMLRWLNMETAQSAISNGDYLSCELLAPGSTATG